MAYAYGCRKSKKIGGKRLYKCKKCMGKLPSMKQVKKSCYRKCVSKAANPESWAARAECKEKCKHKRQKKR